MLTKRQAIRECKRLWRTVLEGEAKEKYEALCFHPKFFEYENMCPLCEYTQQLINHPVGVYQKCRAENICPLVQQTGAACFGEDCVADYLDNPQLFAAVIMALKE